MLNTLLFALSAGTLAFGGAAQAPAASGPAAKQVGKAAEKKICLTYDTRVGSRIRPSECKTRAQWLQEGIDVRRPEKAK